MHPRYLDPQGLVALWREALLARAVLRNETKGYRHHPQLRRFQSQAAPCQAIEAYLAAVLEEAVTRGYSFDPSKVETLQAGIRIACTDGQLHYEWGHLQTKLKARGPAWRQQWLGLDSPEPHPLFYIVAGGIAPWERQTSGN